MNTGAGCLFLLQCMTVKSESEVTQSCPTFSDPMDCSPPGSSIHGIFQARVLEWGAIAFAALDEAQAGIKTAGRNNNKLRYAEDTSLMSEREELKNFLMKVKEES